MSLNGLDDEKVKEAYDAAIVEPGGWFLLNYVSRDEIALLGKGNGGIVEIRNAISKYEEPSPLYGFLRYRRRNVLIKYVPEDCSRLIQARVTVHFTAVTERFSPHDTIFPISTSKELKDTTLSAACSLHTASGSTSSSTSSLRRRRLMEIAEEEEENRAKRQSTVPEETAPGKATSITGPESADNQAPQQPGLTASITQHSEALEVSDFPLPPRSERASIDEPRRSLQSSRPGLYDSYSAYGYGPYSKPKIKLGPRPSLDVGGRPHTSGNGEYRPVATLPAGMKLHSKSSKKDKSRPKSHIAAEPPSMTLSPPVPDMASQFTHGIPVRPHTSGGTSTASMTTMKPLISPTPSTLKGSSITPEKARLMKALELRKKQMHRPIDEPVSPTPDKGFLSPTSTSFEKTVHEEPLTVNEVQPTSISTRAEGIMEEGPGDNSSDILNDMARTEDSGIALDSSSTLRTDESDVGRSDSYPVSPVAPSERAESTRASSISESTDETVQEQHVLEDEKDEKDDLRTGAVSALDIESEHTPKQGIVLSLEEFGSNTTTPDITDDFPQLQPVTYNPSPQVVKVEDGSQVTTTTSVNPANKETPTEPTSSPINEARQWKVPKSKFSIQDLKESTDSILLDVPRSKFNRQEIPDPSGSFSTAQDVPMSKFNMQEFGDTENPISIPREEKSQALVEEPQKVIDSSLPSEEHTTHLIADPSLRSPVSSTFSIDARSGVEEGKEQPQPKLRKRRGFLETIRTDIDANDISLANSEANSSWDDDLMDELQSAVVQEAKPISVSKSPMSPVFPSPSKGSGGVFSRFSRAFSSPNQDAPSNSPQLLSPPEMSQPEKPRAVSASAAYLNRVSQQQAKPMAKKVNLGSGISQRIKALEKLSSSTVDAAATQGTNTTVSKSTAFFSVGKGSIRGTSKSPSVIERANSFTNTISPAPPSRDGGSPETLKLRDRSPSIRSRLDVFSSSPTATSQNKPRPESISVTARIIRDPNQPFPQRPATGKDGSNFTPLNLKESPLEINHQKAVISTPKETNQERRGSNSTKTEEKKRRRSSITVVKDFIEDRRTSFSERRRSMTGDSSVSSPSVLLSPSRPPSTHTTQAHGRPMSISSRFSIGSRDIPLSPPTTSHSGSSPDEKPEKKSNRASRMLRRMSSSLSSGRKTISHAISPTVREESEPLSSPDSQSLAHSQSSNKSVSPVTINVGDVNVQFPDNLLWKRRSMILDSQGYLILSPALTSTLSDRDKGHVGGMRRYHLGEFKLPIIPDVEMQEMPNSVVLDFVEGGELQIACEDRAGQLNVLRVLQDAHRSWASSSH
ncbi:hypothetical protein B7463_g5062, partial [Scytalidium lignicola]